MWSIFNRLCIATFYVSVVFTGCAFFAYKFYWQGGILIGINITLIGLVHARMQSHVNRFIECTPLQVVANSPEVRIPRDMFIPPPLRTGSVGWFPEWGKVWEKYGLPRYTGNDPGARADLSPHQD